MGTNGRNRHNAANIVQFQVTAANATAADTDGILAAVTLDDADPTEVTSGFTQPSVARALSITGNAVGINGDVVIEGTNIRGATITETITANGTSTVAGTKAFQTVTSVTFPARNNSGDTIAVGFTEKIGLPSTLAHNTVLFAFLGNTKEGTAPTVTVSSSAIESNTVDLNSALNGSVVDVYYVI